MSDVNFNRINALMNNVKNGWKELSDRALKASSYLEQWEADMAAGVTAEASAAAANYITEEAGIDGLMTEIANWKEELAELGITVSGEEEFDDQDDDE